MRIKRIYNIYWHMIRRTENPKSKDYHLYGARGIKICDEWRNDYESFEKWSLENGYADNLTIDRKDNFKGYCPSNCRWATRKEQSENKRNTIHVKYNGENVTISELSRLSGISSNILGSRICKYGWSVERAINEPINHVKRDITFNGKTQSISKWAKELNIPYATLKQRFKNGWDTSRALGGVS